MILKVRGPFRRVVPKRTRKAVALAAFVWMGTLLAAAPPVLRPGVPIYDGASAIVVDYYSVPEVVDWNNDGKKDLLVGQFTNGKIKLFLNQGTDAAPSFNGGAYIQSGGVDIQVGYT